MLLFSNESEFYKHRTVDSVKSARLMAANRRVRLSVDRFLVSSPWLVTIFGTRQKQMSRFFFLLLEQPMTRQNEGIAPEFALSEYESLPNYIFTPPTWRPQNFSDVIVMWPHTHYRTAINSPGLSTFIFDKKLHSAPCLEFSEGKS